MNKILNKLKTNPVIAAIRSEQQLDVALKSNCEIIFILSANIFNVGLYIREIKQSNKEVFVHIDFLEGLGKDKKAIEYVAKRLKPDGIITTRSNLIKYAKTMGLFAIQRFFIVDSQSLYTCINTINNVKPDMAEIMPGLMPKIIKDLSTNISIPIIAGGLISQKKEIQLLLSNGAIGVSIGSDKLW